MITDEHVRITKIVISLDKCLPRNLENQHLITFNFLHFVYHKILSMAGWNLRLKS